MFKLPEKYIFTLILVLVIFSCERIRSKGNQVVDKAKSTIADKKAEIGDKIIAHYDAYKPDTKFNKKRFKEFFGFYPTKDVKNIYCHADEMGIDHDYQFSFTCDTATISRIVSNLDLTKAEQPDHSGNGLWHEFSWWESKKITTIKPYWKKGEHETYWFLWYDNSNQKAYYFSFDM